MSQPVPTSPSFDLTGRAALVTGASRGIGRAIAHAFAAAGARVALASRKQEGLDAVAAEIAEAGGEAVAIACHTGHRAEVEAMAARVGEAFGGLDVVVNNAATNPHFGPLLGAEEGHWDKTFEVNVKGYFHLAQAAVPSMRRRGGGAIVNVASIAGTVPHRGLGVYSVSKAAVIMLTKVLASELAADGIRVNAVAPGRVDTPSRAGSLAEPGYRDAALGRIPLHRFGAAEEVAGAVSYLVSPAASYITGQTLVLDGGLTSW